MNWVPTAAQREVLEATTDLLVVGRPGTGKTTVALAKAAAFVETELKPHQRVLFISFSNAAVQRIQASARLNFATTGRGRIEVSTFHAFCYTFLRAHARSAGIPLPFSLLAPETARIIRTTMEERAIGEFTRLEAEEGRVRFERFGPLVLEILSKSPVLRAAYANAYPLIFVDEYQDTDDIHDELARVLGKFGMLVCLGDPDQQIFNWRHGVREDRLDRLLAHGSARRIDLVGPNHRSRESDLIKYARAVLEGRQTISKCKSVQVWHTAKAKDVPDVLKKAVVAAESKVRKALCDRRYVPTVAILARTNKLVGRLATGLRTTSKTFPNHFRHQVMVNPEELGFAWRIALLAMELPVGENARLCLASMFQEMAQMDRWIGTKTALKHAEKLTKWSQTLRARVNGGTAGTKECVELLSQIARQRTGDALTDLCEVRTAMRSVRGGHFKQAVSALDQRLPAGSHEPLTEQIEYLYRQNGSYLGASELVDAFLLRERLTDGALTSARRQLMTLHKCKGKEFDVVIIVDDFVGPGRLASSEDRNGPRIPDDRRLLSVGITRARFCAGILTPRFNRSILLPRSQ